jgi:hypothetical protein
MRSTLVGLWIPLAALVAGCAGKKFPPPAEQTVELGGKKATYREWPAGKLCQGDPRRIALDFTSMNVLLTDFLQRTSAGTEGMWADDQLEMLQRATLELGPVVDKHEAALNTAARCGFPANTNIPEQQRVGLELVSQTRARLAQAPELLTVANQRKEIAKWKESQTAAQEQAKTTKCAKPKAGAAGLFYASEDDKGTSEWLFCDGSKVVAQPGSKHEYVAPSGKHAAAKTYIDAALKLSANNIVRSPKMPAKPPPGANEEPKEEPAADAKK